MTNKIFILIIALLLSSISALNSQNVTVSGGTGTVTSVICGTGLSGGTITTSGTCAHIQPKIITITRDLSVASGDVAYTGCGFAPKYLLSVGGITAGSSYNNFFGMTANAGGAGQASSVAAGATTVSTAQFIGVYDTTGANQQVAVVSTWDSDGFTLTWTKVSAPSGTATFYILCGV